jgi:hypothetical protein
MLERDGANVSEPRRSATSRVNSLMLYRLSGTSRSLGRSPARATTNARVVGVIASVAIATLSYKASQPASNRRSAHVLLPSQRATAQSIGVAKDETGTTDEALRCRSGANPAVQLTDFTGHQLDRGDASGHVAPPAAKHTRLAGDAGRVSE